MNELPFAITLDVGSSHANHTGSWRVERPVYVDRMPPCNDACPAGENIQHWLYDAEPGDYEAAWRQLVEDNPLPAVMGRICYHPCETACNRAQLDEAVGINAIERFLGDLAIERGWALPPPGADTGKRVLVVGGGPVGAQRRLPPAPPRPRGPPRRLCPEARRHDALRHPRLPAPRERSSTPRSTASSPSASRSSSTTPSTTSSASDAKAASTPSSSASVPSSPGESRSPRATPSRILDAVSFLHRVADERSASARASRRRLRRWRHRARRRAHGAPTRRDRRRHRLSPQPGAHAGPRRRARRGPRGGRDDALALDGQPLRRRPPRAREDAPQRQRAFPSRPASSKSSARTHSCSPSARTPISRSSRSEPDITIEDGVVDGLARHDGRLRTGSSPAVTRCPLRARRRSPSGTASAPPGASTPISPATSSSTPPRHELATFERSQHLVLRGRSAHAAPRARAGPAPEHLRRGRRRPHRGERPLRGPTLPVVRQLLRMRQLLRRLPGQRRDQARSVRALRVRLRLLQGLRHLRQGVPVRRHRDGSRADLTRRAVQALRPPDWAAIAGGRSLPWRLCPA